MTKPWLVLLLLTVAAGAQTFESLGQPCRAFNVLASRVVAAPDGKEYFVLSNTNEISGVELIFIDFAANTERTFRAPAGQGAWSLNEVPGKRLVVGTYYDGKMMVFDLKTMSFTKVISFPGEQYFWNAAIGSDGRLFGGTYPGAKLGALNLDTLEIEDCGAPALPNLYLRNVSALPDGRLLCNFVTSAPKTKIYDPKSKQWSDPPDHFKHVQRGVVWNDHFLAGGSWDGKDPAKGAVAFKGLEFTSIDPPPFPLPPDDGNTWAVDLTLTTADTLYIHRGNARFRLAKGKTALTKVFDHDLKSGYLTAVASDGTLLGVRGQDYLIAKPGETNAKLIPIPAESSPRPVHFIKPDDNGRLWGGPVFGQTMFYVDLATKKVTNTGIVCNAGGEVYDAAFLDGKTYAVSYAAGDIIEFDPSQPWDQLSNKNPKTIAHLTSKGYIRPVAGVLVGPDKKLYSGWMAKYGTYGGAIAITDPATGKTELIENPLGEQAIRALAVDDKYIYAGTSIDGNGLPNKPNARPQLGIIDRETRKVLHQLDMPGGEVSKIIADRKTGKTIVAFAGTMKFLSADAKLTDIPNLSPVSAHAIDGIGDGFVWFASANKLVRCDLATNEIKSFDSPIAVEHLGVGAKDVFVSSGPSIYRLALESKP
jgi:streptogramin lyase